MRWTQAGTRAGRGSRVARNRRRRKPKRKRNGKRVYRPLERVASPSSSGPSRSTPSSSETEQKGASLKKVLGPWQPHGARRRRHHRHRASSPPSAPPRRATTQPPRRRAGPDGLVRAHRGRLRFTALCYAEFASMVPVAGSAYTYAYATLGELVAWIIGWDLLLEYAIGNTAVAISWAGYADALLARPRRAPAPLARDRLPHGRELPGDILAQALRTSSACRSSSTPWRWASSRRSSIVLVVGREGVGALQHASWSGVKLVVLAFFVVACTEVRADGQLAPLRPQRLRGRSGPAPRSSSSRTSASTPSRRAPRSARTPGATCPSASSGRSSSARSSTSSSRRSSRAWCPTRRS